MSKNRDGLFDTLPEAVARAAELAPPGAVVHAFGLDGQPEDAAPCTSELARSRRALIVRHDDWVFVGEPATGHAVCRACGETTARTRVVTRSARRPNPGSVQ